jgi:DNA-binding NarL/FixJ family response regulator
MAMSGAGDPIRVLLASASPQANERLAALLSGHESVQVEGTATSPSEVWKAARERPFDVLLTDLDLTGFDPVRVTRSMNLDGREVQLVELSDPQGESPTFTAVSIAVALFHHQPFSRDEFLALVRQARGC